MGVDRLKKRKHSVPYSPVTSFITQFETVPPPPATRGETREEQAERKKTEKKEAADGVLQEKLIKWDPHSDKNATGDPFKTLFVARINYDTTESKLRRELETYWPIRQINMIYNIRTRKPRGYALVEYEHERDMHSAYKHADGKKIDGRRILVDVERGRTVKSWRPRRLGGVLGGTRRGGPDENIRHSGRVEQWESTGGARNDREREKESRTEEKPRKRSRSPRDRRDRDRDRDRNGGKDVVIVIAIVVTVVRIVLIVETVKIVLNVLIVMIVPRKENATIALSAERSRKVLTLPNEPIAKNVECVLNVNAKSVLMMKGRTVIEENVVVVIVSAGIEIGIEIEIVIVVDVTVIAVIRSVNLVNGTVTAVNAVIRSAMVTNVNVIFQKGGTAMVTEIVIGNEKGKERGKGKGIVNHVMKVNYHRMTNPLNLNK